MRLQNSSIDIEILFLLVKYLPLNLSYKALIIWSNRLKTMSFSYRQKRYILSGWQSKSLKKGMIWS